MAIEYVGGKAGAIAGSTATNTDISLSTGLAGGLAAGVSTGDLVIATYVIGTAGTRTPSIVDPSAVAYIAPWGQSTGSDNFDAMLRMGYKFMPATPDAIVRFGPTGATADGGAYAIQVWRGVSLTQPMDLSARGVNAQGGNTARPNPASVQPLSSGAIVVAGVGGAAADMSVAFAFTTVDNLIQATQAATNDARAAMMSRAWSGSGAVDIAVATAGSNTTSDSWASTVIALRPAGSEKLGAPFAPPLQSFQHLLVR